MDIAYAAILIWIPVSALFFGLMRPARALVLVYLIGWLALPRAAVPIAGFWDIDKILATNAGVLLGTLLFCHKQFKGYTFSVADLALLTFAAGTCVTSVVNRLGIYDGVSSFGLQIARYGMPFCFGRAFIKTRSDLDDACRVIIGAAAFYAVLAVWEWRMSPNIHKMLYGYFQASFAQHLRWGYHRPIVCFPHALGLGTFFAWTSLLTIACVRTGRLRPICGFPPSLYAWLPLVGLATSMSLGPWGLFVLALGLLISWQHSHQPLLICVPVLFAVLWISGRYTNLTDGKWMSAAIRQISPVRAHSLEGRIEANTLLIARAKQKPLFGWGTWGRNRIVDKRGRDVVPTDGLWILLLGSYGLVGLISFYLWWCWPVLLNLQVKPAGLLEGAMIALLLGIAIQSFNFVFNGFLSPVLSLMHGSLVTLLTRVPHPSRTPLRTSVMSRSPRPIVRRPGYAS